MKKLMIAAAAAFCGTVFGLESANIVGYNSVAVKGGKLNLLTVSFETVGGKESTATLNDVMDTTQLTSYSEDGNTPGDYIDSWDMANGNWGERYFYVNLPSWNYDNVDYTDTWADSNLTPVNPTMANGSSFWLYHAGDDIESLTFAGQVGTVQAGYTLAGGKLNLCGNPFPTALNLSNKKQVTITNPTSYSEDGNTPGDYIDTWDLSTGNWGERYFYVNLPSWNYDNVDYTDTWADSNLTPTATDIQAGAGFWYYAAGEGTTLTFSAL